MNIIALLIPPLVGGLIALSTNWIAIKMLFRPYTKKRLFGIPIPFTPGLIPKERGRLARKLGEAISTHLLTPDVLAGKLANPSTWPLPDCTVGQLLENWGIDDPGAYLEAQLSQPSKKAADALLPKAIELITSFPQRFPALDSKLAELTAQVAEKSISRLAGLFVSKDKIYSNIKEAVFEYVSNPDNQEALREVVHSAIDKLLATQHTRTDADDEPSLTQRITALHIKTGAEMLFAQEPYATITRRTLTVLATYLATHMPIADMIEEKMNAFDIAETEAMILSAVGRELRLIIMLGGVFGFLIGLLMLVGRVF